MRRALAAFLFALVAGCESSPPPVFLEYCVPVDSSGDVPTVGVVMDYKNLDSAPSSTDARVQDFVVATESPLTVVQGEPGYVERSMVVVDRYSSQDVAARLAFPSINVLQTETVSLPFSTSRAQGILGGDVLRMFAVRMYYGQDPECTFDWTPGVRWPSVTFLREVPDKDDALATDGFGVFRFTLAGGGNMVVDGEEYTLRASRVGVWVCLDPDPFEPDDPPIPVHGHYPVSGTDAYALVATGTEPLVLTSGLAERLTTDASITLESQNFDVMGESVPGARVRGLHTIAIVGDVDDGLSPCAELAKRLALEYERHHPGEKRYPEDMEGPYAPAVLITVGDATDSQELDTVSVSEESTLWSSLWGETLPDVPMYDVLLGGAVLGYLEFTIDYPERRVIARCAGYVPPTAGVCQDATSTPCCVPDGPCTLTTPCMQLP